MSERHFETKSFVKNYESHRPRLPNEIATVVIDFLKSGLKSQPPWPLMLDTGCGGGQSTESFSPHFDRIIGIDVSPNQIEIANQRKSKPNVEYRVGLAEDLDVADQSVTLVTAFAAIHWFDLEKFYREAHRVLIFGGLIAAMCYNLIPSSARRPNAIASLCSKEALHRIWLDFYAQLDKSPKDNLFIQRYRNLPQPNAGLFAISHESHFATLAWTVNDLVNFLTSLSCFDRQERKNPEKAATAANELRSRLIEILRVNVDEVLNFEFEYFIVFFKKI